MEDKKKGKGDKQFKKAERKLYDYKGLKADVECLEYELLILKDEYNGCKAITYTSETTGVTNNITDTVYEELIRKEKDILDKTKKINKKKIQINDLWLFLLPESPASKRCKGMHSHNLLPNIA